MSQSVYQCLFTAVEHRPAHALCLNPPSVCTAVRRSELGITRLHTVRGTQTIILGHALDSAVIPDKNMGAHTRCKHQRSATGKDEKVGSTHYHRRSRLNHTTRHFNIGRKTDRQIATRHTMRGCIYSLNQSPIQQ